MVFGAVLTALAAQLAIPLPGTPVPLTGQSFAAIAVGGLWGRWRGAGSLVLYLLLGAAGVPAFADGAAGWRHLAGGTGGYLAGLVVAAWVAGFLVERTGRRSGSLRVMLPAVFGALLSASVPILALGAVRLAVEIGWERAWAVGVEPFVLGAAIKALLAAVVVTAGFRRTGLGILLFSFIPLVLWLLVTQPEPLGWSLVSAVVLMLGHRFIARPFMEAVGERRCLWCCRAFEGRPAGEALQLDTAGGPVTARVCARHRESTGRFFGFLEAARGPLAAGIFVPLLALLAALAAAVAGWPAAAAPATAWFRLWIGLTVVTAATAYPWVTASPTAEGRPPRVRFPAHNFFLLGVRALLWIFRLVGVWWIALGLRSLLGG